MPRLFVGILAGFLLTGPLAAAGAARTAPFPTAADSSRAAPFRRLRLLPVPAFGYEPETRWHVGAVALAQWRQSPTDTLRRPGNAKAEINLTQNRQLVLASEWNTFSPGERTLTQGSVSFLRFPEDYWGVGNAAPAVARGRYDSHRFEARRAVLRQVWPHVYVGPRAVAQGLWRVRPLAGGLLDRRTVTGATGGWSVGAGAAVAYDTRPSVFTPTRGALVSTAVTAFRAALGSAFRFTRFELDARRYWSLGRRVTLAGQLTATVHTGEPPFRMLALLGSDGPMRGYYRGRFRDRQLAAAQAEVRFPLLWRFGAAAFAGAGQVARGFDEFGLRSLKPSFGGGLRFLVDRQENVNLRLDYGIGEGGNTGFYVSFGEAF
ncbi:MAG: BamA/TamA family outer membrane protein [Hymenobacteraceae bacterium]|nr:BamA/TamA family outer membrane protein [Hymenobacteraceae bacterium]